MKGRTTRAEATHAMTLIPLKEQCEQCGQPLWVGYHAHRTVTRLPTFRRWVDEKKDFS
jgi:hypothetical protein